MATKTERWAARLEPYLVGRPNSKGEWKTRCPLHDDDTPSASTNFDKGIFHCAAGCGGCTLDQLMTMMDREDREDDSDEEAFYNPFGDDADVIDIAKARTERENKKKKVPLSEAKVRGFHEALMSDAEALAAFKKKRGLTDATIKKFKVGYERRASRYTIPVYDDHDALVNVRRYKPDAEASQKMWNWVGYGSPPRLYPQSEMEHDTILLVEGELDALIAIQNGFHAVSGTGGVMRWDPQWSKEFDGKHVYICYDNDKEGRTGAKKVKQALKRHAASVVVLPALVPDVEKSDITDYFLNAGTAKDLRALMKATEPEPEVEPDVVPEADPVSVQVIGSMDSRTNGKPLTMAVTVVGRKDPTYSVPERVQVTCTLDAGPKCKGCPMFTEYEGEHEVLISKYDVPTIARFIDAKEDQVTELLRKEVGAVKCSRFVAEKPKANLTVEELFVMTSVDQRTLEGADYTQRRIYNVVSDGKTATNIAANVIGTTWPSPKDRLNEFFSWHMEEATTSIDKVEVTPAMIKQLKKFQPKGKQTSLDKCMEIALDLSETVTKIHGRERMHVAFDLVWHSAMRFPFDGKMMTRGWLEFIVVGETRTGKSETAQRLAEHYGLGHVVGCEGATFAGLVGGVKQVGQSWTVQWGEITINDRRLVVLDEASGLSQDIISQLSDIRTRGVAQLTKVETRQTNARTRLAWISNPRKSKFVDEKRVDGVDLLEDLIGNPEDIARFDFAMSVRADDVPSNKVNNPEVSLRPPRYSAEDCHALVLWAWSRKPDQIMWQNDEAYREVFRAADWLGNRYVGHPPLIQRTNVREKVARLAVAFAMRTFSTEDGEMVIVTRQHVKDATNFLDKLYSYDNFGYRRMSKREHKNREIASAAKPAIKKYLMSKRRLLEFLLDRRGSSFRGQDLEEMALMQRDEVNAVLGKLSDAKMISKEKSQIVLEPELQELLREMDK